MGKTENLIFYSLILAQIVEPFNSIKRRTYECGAIILGHIVESFHCTKIRTYGCDAIILGKIVEHFSYNTYTNY